MQQLIHYVNYFFFLCIHFNPALAFGMIRDEIWGEKKYGIHTTDIIVTNKLKIKGVDTSDANDYMPSNYVLLEQVFTELNTYPHNKTFLDFGCGKGRTLIVAAHFGFQQLTGVEFIEANCKDAQQQIKPFQSRFHTASFHIASTDAATYIVPDEVQTIFFYNPFNEAVMKKVVQHIAESLARKKRPLFIVYLSPLYKQLFFELGFREVFHTMRFGYLKASILRLA